MSALRKALAALFLVFATVAFALTPGERIVLFSGIHPVWQANFLGASSLPAGLTFSRSTTATYFNSSGVLSTAAINAPRLDTNPSTLAPRGLLVEEARTNIALYSRDMTNAAWVKSSITAALNQTGLDGVANSASSITASGANGTILQTVTLASSQRFYSAYVKRITGSGAVSMTTDNGTTWTAITVTGSWTQVSIPAQTVTNPVFGFKLATNGDAIAVDCNQNEGGAFATSAIITTSASVQRTADVITFSGVPLAALQGAQASAAAEWLPYNNTTNGRYVMSNDVGTVIPLYKTNIETQIRSYGGTNVATSTIGGGAAWTDFVTLRAAASWNAGATSVVANGGTVGTAAAGFGAVANMYLGSASNSAFLNGWVRSLAIYNQRLPDATLKAKSVVGAPY